MARYEIRILADGYAPPQAQDHDTLMLQEYIQHLQTHVGVENSTVKLGWHVLSLLDPLATAKSLKKVQRGKFDQWEKSRTKPQKYLTYTSEIDGLSREVLVSFPRFPSFDDGPVELLGNKLPRFPL